MDKYPAYLLFGLLILVVMFSGCKKENSLKKDVFDDPNVIKVQNKAVILNDALPTSVKERYIELLKKIDSSDKTKTSAGGPPPPGGGPHGKPETEFKYPANWPNGLKAYKASTITQWNANNYDARLIYVSDADQSVVEKHIETNMKASGYTPSVKTPGKFLSIWEYTKSNSYMRFIIKQDPTRKTVEVDGTWVNNSPAK